MDANWEQDASNTPGLFPVPIYRNEDDPDPNKQHGCSCGYECTSGACCCYMGASDLSCQPPGKAACGAQQRVSDKASDAKDPSGQPSENLLTLALAASSVPPVKDGRDDDDKTEKKVCKRCKRSLDRSAFCANFRAADGLYTQCRSCVSQKDQARRQKVKQEQKPPAASKVCSRCQTQKPSTEFYLDNSRPDGLQTYCRACFSLHYKERRQQRHKV